MSFRTSQVNFSRGEMAPQLYGRFDTDAWQAALGLARNVIILKYGGITKRPGTRLVAEAINQTSDVRLIPFQFSLEQTYALEFGQGYMSPTALGGRLLEDEYAITAISNAATAQITMAFHAYLPGDLIYLTGIDGDMGVLLNERAWTVLTVVDANNFTIAADTTAVSPFTFATGGATRVAAPDPIVPPTVPAVVTAPIPPNTYGGGAGDFNYRYNYVFPF